MYEVLKLKKEDKLSHTNQR